MLGNAVAYGAGVDPSFAATVGFEAVLAGSTGTPSACAVMAAECFGWGISLYALATCRLAVRAAERDTVCSVQGSEDRPGLARIAP